MDVKQGSGGGSGSGWEESFAGDGRGICTPGFVCALVAGVTDSSGLA